MDLIDRQEAIDALHTWFRDGFEEDKWWNSTHVLAALEGVPSAHPELDEWCDTCKEYDQERHCCPRWNRVIKTTLEEVKPIISCTLDEQQTARALGMKQGKWINGYCSNCREHAPYWPMASTYYESKFCPNCGSYNGGEE